MGTIREGALRRAIEQLTRVQSLLLRGGSGALGQAEQAMGEIRTWVGEAATGTTGARDLGADKAELFEFELAARRTAKLLEGARRAQWIQLRRLRASGETYTARGELRGLTPRGTLNMSA